MQVISALRFQRDRDSKPLEKRFRRGSGCNDDSIRLKSTSILQPDCNSLILRLNASSTTYQELPATRGKMLREPLHQALRIGNIAVLRLKNAAFELIGKRRSDIVNSPLIEDFEIHPAFLPKLPAAHSRLESAAVAVDGEAACPADQVFDPGGLQKWHVTIENRAVERVQGIDNLRDASSTPCGNKTEQPRHHLQKI